MQIYLLLCFFAFAIGLFSEENSVGTAIYMAVCWPMILLLLAYIGAISFLERKA
jgi:hypothetical protein